MKRGGPLPRYTAPRRGALSRQAERTRNARPARAVEAPAWPVAGVRQLAIVRSGWACDRCGIPLAGQRYSLQHRRARAAGGRQGHALDTPWNLIVLCGSATSPGCHNLIENQQRQAEGYDRGFAIRGEHTDPAVTPIFRHLQQWVIPSIDDRGDLPLPKRGIWVPAQAIAA